MSLSKNDVCKVIDTYLRAWTNQDPDLIITIFTPTATYHERVLQEPIRDLAGIRDYWQTKVVKEQANIQAQLLSGLARKFVGGHAARGWAGSWRGL
jgi:hypothetical protein